MKRIFISISFLAITFNVNAQQFRLPDRYGNFKQVQAGQEPWNVGGTETPASSNTQNVYVKGFVGSFTDNQDNPVPQASFSAIQKISGIARMIEIVNMIENVQGNGVEIKFGTASNTQWTSIQSICKGVNRIGSNTALEIKNVSSREVYLDLETGGGNPYEGNLGIGVRKAAVGDREPTQRLDVNGNARIRGLVEGSNQTDNNFTRTIVAKSDGTLGYTDGEIRRVRLVSNNTEAVMNPADEVLLITTINVSVVKLPSNPPVGKVVTIISLSRGVPTISPSYIPNKMGAATVIASHYTLADYKNTIKPRTIVKLIFISSGFAGGSGWLQIGGDNQN